MKIQLSKVDKNNLALRQAMSSHYSKPNGFVGRSICYGVFYDNTCFGFIVGGSATKHLPGRDEFFKYAHLDNLVNNIFFHIEKQENKYPLRNFVSKVIGLWRERIVQDWPNKYNGDVVLGFETLVEIPRTGNCYLLDGWTLIGQTKGFTCKRVAGQGSDNWSGKRIWNKSELRPKLVLVKRVENLK